MIARSWVVPGMPGNPKPRSPPSPTTAAANPNNAQGISGAGTWRLGHFVLEFGRRAVACASGALKVGLVEVVECFPVPGVRFRVVGRVVGHRESVVRGVEREGVADSGVSKRAFQ